MRRLPLQRLRARTCAPVDDRVDRGQRAVAARRRPAGLGAGACAHTLRRQHGRRDVARRLGVVGRRASPPSTRGERSTAVAIGSTDITATFGDVTSAPLALTVVERPTLQRIYVQNINCYYSAGLRRSPATASAPVRCHPIRTTSCRAELRPGRADRRDDPFRAIGEFANGYYEDITDEVEWQRRSGRRSATWSAGSSPRAKPARRRSPPRSAASTSDAVRDSRRHRGDGRVALDLRRATAAYPAIRRRPGAAGSGRAVLRLRLLDHRAARRHCAVPAPRRTTTPASGRTSPSEVTWRSSDAAVAAIDASGVMTGGRRRHGRHRRPLGDVTSNARRRARRQRGDAAILYIYQEGTDRVVAKGDQRFFHAIGNYDIGFERDVTAEATWRSSDDDGRRLRHARRLHRPRRRDGRKCGPSSTAARATPVARGARDQRAGLLRCRQRQSRRLVGRLQPRDARVRLRRLHAARRRHAALHGDRDAAARRHLRSVSRPLRLPGRQNGAHDARGRLRRSVPAGGAPGRDEAVLKYQLRAFWDLKDETRRAGARRAPTRSSAASISTTIRS